jgi:hypothetical protein
MKNRGGAVRLIVRPVDVDCLLHPAMMRVRLRMFGGLDRNQPPLTPTVNRLPMAMSDQINPYESPRLSGEQDDPPIEWQDRDLTAQLVQRGWVYRKVQLFGGISATVEYNGRGFGYETVSVDGTVAGTSHYQGWESFTLFLCPQIPFNISAGGVAIPAKIEVRATLYVTLAAFRLWVGDRVVYNEGIWSS